MCGIDGFNGTNAMVFSQCSADTGMHHYNTAVFDHAAVPLFSYSMLFDYADAIVQALCSCSLLMPIAIYCFSGTQVDKASGEERK